MSNPCFLTLKTTIDQSGWNPAIAAARGTILASGSADAVTPLEPGTTHSGLVIARFAFAEDRDAFWTSPTAQALIAADTGLVALACGGIAYEGWPGNFVPTIATVDVPDAGAPRTFMVIEGTGTDQERMDRYRDMILPMMRTRGAYYVAFELGGDVRVLAGTWSEGIFAISRWPSAALAKDFWYCDQYQTQAIPIRTGVGKFDVQIIEGIAG
ncbi:MAG: DUF1330 domain-containing protein [Sphingopyxis sp.]|nr:DUF1330 domain-containing protein [Sphingopyxis sp.]